MSSRTDTAGHSKAFDYPDMGHWGKPKCTVPRVGLEPTTHRLTATAQCANSLSPFIKYSWVRRECPTWQLKTDLSRCNVFKFPHPNPPPPGIWKRFQIPPGSYSDSSPHFQIPPSRKGHVRSHQGQSRKKCNFWPKFDAILTIILAYQCVYYTPRSGPIHV